jgi:hypothetical protein
MSIKNQIHFGGRLLNAPYFSIGAMIHYVFGPKAVSAPTRANPAHMAQVVTAAASDFRSTILF